MTLSRRSFLKVAGLTVVAAAGASMFTGCGAFSTTPITLVSADDSTEDFKKQIVEWNKKKLVVYPSDAKGSYLDNYLKSYLPNALGVKKFNDTYEITDKKYDNVKEEGSDKTTKKLVVTLKEKKKSTT